MYNPYQSQGNALNQQQTGFYSQPAQQPPLPSRATTTEFGNLQQNVPTSFGNQQPTQQFGNVNAGQSQAQQTGFAQPSYGQFSSQQTGYARTLNQPQQSGFGHSGALQGFQQPQQTGYFSQQPTTLQQQQPQSSFYSQSPAPPAQNAAFNLQDSQNAPPATLQPQTTGFFSQQPLQQTLQPQHQPLQSQQQPLSQQPLQPQPQQQPLQSQQQPLQPQQTGFYSQQQAQPLQPQQTGFYSQQQSAPLQPLKPTATGFVNSFANNGVNNSLKIPNMRLSFITAPDQAKFETLFRSSVPQGSNTISGENCRAILMKSGLAPSQLARIWTLCDTSKAGELLFPEFALAMHLVNDVLQGDSIPYELDTKTKNEVSSFVDAINFSIAGGDYTESSKPKTPFDDLTAGIPSLNPQPTGFMPQTSFGMPLQSQVTGGQLNSQSTGFMPQTSFGQPLNTQITGGPLQSQMTGGLLQSQSTGGMLQPQSTGFMPQTSFNQPLQGQATGGGFQPQTSFNQPLQTQLTGGALQQPQMPLNQSLQSQATGGRLQPQNTAGLSSFTSVLQNQQTGSMPPSSFGNSFPLQSQPTGFLPPSNFNPTAPLIAQKTGFGNNEIYSQSNFASKFTADNSDFITAEEKALFYKIFETYDTKNKGLMDSPTAVEIFRKSGLNRSDLEQIWNLCDTNNSGQLNKQEFALGMHLVYRRLNGHTLPARLPVSLIPSSTRILDSVKDQLKNNDLDNSKKTPTKADGLKFKNNDDELLPSSRNRRKTFVDVKEIEGNKGTIAALKKLINEKQVKLDMETRHSSQSYHLGNNGEDDAKIIEGLKKRILSLPKSPTSHVAGVPYDLKTKFDSLVGRVPELLAEISRIDNQITNAKVELYRLRNPSSLVGSGPNGEITEQDRKKAKSKALLASRMAALTGKPVSATSDLEKEEQKFNAEVLKIKNDNANNQAIINDIQTSIAEIAASVHFSLTGHNTVDSTEDYEKWELGVGVDAEVSQFIRQLKSGNSSTNYKSNSSDYATQQSSQFSQQRPPLLSSESGSSSQFSSAEERAAYLKEQAQRKMREKLAKLGLGGEEPSDRSTNVQAPTHVQKKQLLDQELTVKSEKPQTSVPAKQAQAGEEPDEDEEVKRLMQQLEDLKAKKKAEREDKLAKLRKEVENAQNEDEDSWDEAPQQVQKLSSNAPLQTQTANSTSTQVPISSTQGSANPARQYGSFTSSPTPISTNVQQSSGSHHEHNPFSKNSKPSASASGQALSSTSTGGRNPFFKQTASTSSSFDAKAAEAQRRVQRGLDNDDDDDWSDDESQTAQKGPEPEAVGGGSSSQSQMNSAPESAPVPPVNNSSIIAAPIAPIPPKVEASHSSEPSSAPVPVAPPLPAINASAIPPVPVAPPLPQMNSSTAPPVPIAPPLPQVNEITAPVPKAPSPVPVPSSQASHPVPIAPPLPQVAIENQVTEPSGAFVPQLSSTTAGAVGVSTQVDEGNEYESDDLSIPDSVASEDDDDFRTPALDAPSNDTTQLPPSGIPPPPPLP